MRVTAGRHLRLSTGAALSALLAVAACGRAGGPSAVSAGSSALPAHTAGADTTTGAGTAGTGTTSTAAAGAVPIQSWAGYHGDQERTGAVAAVPSLNPASRTWSTDLGGAVYGQAVVGLGRVYAATERNRVAALSPVTGKVLWSTLLGTPLTDVDRVAGCGDIDPLGVTSTPVLDVKAGRLYVAGEVRTSGGVHHQLTGLDAATGRVVLSRDIDPPLPPGEKAVNLLQRASLALANGRVYVPFGGNDGDCGSYHGWLVSVPETGNGAKASFEVAADGEGGAIWESGGAPAVDAHGNLFLSTGNANPDPPQGGPDPKAYTESVVKLSPALVPLAAFKDRVAGGDEDLATGNPVLLPGGLVFSIGKTDVGYLLRQSDLHQVAAITGVCGSDPDGGPAYDPATRKVYVPCRGGGIAVVNVATRSVGTSLAGADGAPIVLGGDVWAAQYPQGILSEYDAGTGRRLQTLSVSQSVPYFVSPSTGLGLLLIGTRSGVTAFR